MVFMKGGLNVIISATGFLLSDSAKLNFCTSNPALHKYPSRYGQPLFKYSTCINVFLQKMNVFLLDLKTNKNIIN